ncbi:MAG: trypsin-like peptidase domain-containing protein [Venatoribacter sp.]
MRALLSFLYHLILPALIGCASALLILIFAPQITEQLPAALRPPAQEAQSPDTPEAPAALTKSQPLSYADAVDLATPSVVNIYTRTLVRRKRHPIFDDPLFLRFFGVRPEPDERVESSLGSGVIMRSNGYILTNNHVINGADEIVVALRDGREANAQVVGSDPDSDLALLKVNLTNLPAIPIAQTKLRVGDVVLAIGNPFGVGQTVTMGIVSATGRNQLGLSTYEDYIQTDAAINPGNSGGALINSLGELAGLNTAIFSQSGGNQGIGFAIPANIAERTVEDIIEHGRPIRGWLGIEVQESTQALLEALDLPKALTGLIVTGLYPQGPAEQAGLSVGDIIVAIDSSNAIDAHKAMNQIAALRPGEKISIKYLHAGKTLITEATAGQRKTLK